MTSNYGIQRKRAAKVDEGAGRLTSTGLLRWEPEKHILAQGAQAPELSTPRQGLQYLYQVLGVAANLG